MLRELAQKALPSVDALYAKSFLVNAGLPLRGSELKIQTALDVMRRNLHLTDDDPFRAHVVSGVPGAGKTRMGYELLRLWDDEHVLASLKQTAGSTLRVIRAYIDFNNGCSYMDGVDSSVMTWNLGARLAAQLLGIPLSAVHDKNEQTLKGLTVDAVLTAVLEREEAREDTRSSAAGRPGAEAAAGEASVLNASKTFVIAVHLDEYQSYIYQLALGHAAAADAKYSFVEDSPWTAKARSGFKQMVSALFNFTRGPAAERWKMWLVLVITGTPLLGVPPLPTDKIVQELMSPAVFSSADAEQLVAAVMTRSIFGKTSPLENMLPAVLTALRGSVAQAAVGDTGFRPRLLVNLGSNALSQLRGSYEAAILRGVVESDAAGMALTSVDWRLARDMVARPFDELPTGRRARLVLVELALLQVPVKFVFSVGETCKTDAEAIVAAEETSGSIDLEKLTEKSMADYRIVRMPLMQVSSWGTTDFLPRALTDIPRERDWAYLELLCACIIRVRMNYHRRSTSCVVLADILPGARGAASAKDLAVRLPDRADVYIEKKQFLTRKDSRPARVMTVQAALVGGNVFADYRLDEGVFCTCVNTALIDVRLSLRLAEAGAVPDQPGDASRARGKAARGSYVHLYVQLRHTSKSRTVTADAIRTWHEEAANATACWSAGQDRVIYVYVSNRRVAEAALTELQSPSFFEGSGGDLMVVTRDELAVLLSPALSHRMLLTPQVGSLNMDT